MTRSGYHDDLDGWSLIRWRGAVASAIRGARGQAFLKEMLKALDALPEKKLIASALVSADGECCALGSVALLRQLETKGVDAYDREAVADLMGIAEALAAEIAFVNDDDFRWSPEAEVPENRFSRVRAWVVENIRADAVEATPA